MRIAIAILICALLGLPASAAIFAVPSVHASIQAAHNHASFTAGDTIHVNAAAYTGDERVDWTKDGTAGNFINVISTNGRAVMRGYGTSSANYVKFINFEIRHPDTSHRAAFDLAGAAGTSSHIHIIDCYIHDVHREGMHLHNTTFAVVRGTVIYWVAHPGSIQEPDDAIGADLDAGKALIEYVEIHRARDYCTVYGTNHIFRNFWMSDTDLENYWVDIDTHSDFFQPGSDGAETHAMHHVIEAGLMGDNPGTHGHGILQQDNAFHSDTNFLIRGCGFYNVGGAGIGTFGTEYVQEFNNTFWKMMTPDDGSPEWAAGDMINWYRTIAQAGGSIGGLLINTLVANMATGNNAINIDAPDNDVFHSHNWGYGAGTESSFVGTTNPLLMDTNALDLRLQESSPVRGQGRFITVITNANGSGTSFGVTNKHRFINGWGLVEGDILTTGGTTTRVTATDYENNIITVRDAVSWTNNQPVYWGPLGAQKDIGAYPYGAQFLTAATYSRNGNTYSASTTGDARGVWFYVDFIPKHWIYEKTNGVYSVTDAGNVTAIKAYPYYMQTNVVGIAATLAGSGSTAACIVGAGRVRGGRR